MVKRNRRRPAVKITGGGTWVVNHVGTRLLADLADQLALTTALSTAMAPTKRHHRGHDRVVVELERPDYYTTALLQRKGLRRFSFRRAARTSRVCAKRRST